jgi:hypothetical protein
MSNAHFAGSFFANKTGPRRRYGIRIVAAKPPPRIQPPAAQMA